MELSDFFYSYPDISDNNFQKIINRKVEFIETGAILDEKIDKVPGVTRLLRHQRLMMRLISQFDELLFFHGTGSGKTCASVVSTEGFFIQNLPRTLNHYINSYVENKHSHIKKIHVLVKGDSLKTEFIKQVVKDCTDGRYITDEVKKAKTPQEFLNAAKSAISKFFIVETYGSFINSVYPFDPEDGEDESEIVLRNIENVVNNSAIIIDEVHNLRMEDSGKEYHELESITEGNRIINKDSTKNILFGSKNQKDIQYRRLKNIIQKSTHRKVILLSGTPMIGDPDEARAIMNLILPPEKQIPFSLNMNEATIEELEPYMRGKISYIRPVTTFVRSEYKGEVFKNVLSKEDEGSLVLYPSIMESFQGKVYLKTPTGVFETRRQEAADFVFPDGSIGAEGFKKYVVKSSGDIFRGNSILTNSLRDDEKLKSMSTKYHAILNLVSKSEGNSFIYTNKVHGSGSIVLGLVFESNGYSRFKQITSDPENVTKKNRYAIITSSTSPEEQISIQDIYNSKENVDGELIKVIIGSRVARDGLNLSNVRWIHLASGDWTESSNFQAISRGLRSGSHNHLIKTMKERDPDSTGDLVVGIYKHVALVKDEDFEEVGGDKKSIDLMIYSIAQKRDIRIKRLQRIMMRLAIDCSFNRERNVIRGKDFSQECDYDMCDYSCYPEDEIDKYIFDSYDNLYSKDLVESLVKTLKKYLKLNFSISSVEMKRIFKNVPDKFVQMVIHKTKKDNEIFNDRFGRLAVIEEIDGGVALTPYKLYPENTPNLINDNFYSKILSTTEYNSISELSMTKGDISSLISQLRETRNVENFMKSLSREDIVEVVEDVFLRAALAETNLTSNEIDMMKIFSNIVIETKEYKKSINILKTKILDTKGKRGRKPLPENILSLPTENIELIDEDSIVKVWVHRVSILFSPNKGLASIKDVVSKKDIRILKIEPGGKTSGWRDLTVFETPIYKKVTSEHLESVISSQEKGSVNGITWPLGTDFIIIDRLHSEKSTGRNCLFWKKPDIIEVMYRIGVPSRSRVNINMTREDMENKISEIKFSISTSEMSTDFIFYVGAWIESNLSTKDLCVITKNFMEDNDLVIKI